MSVVWKAGDELVSTDGRHLARVHRATAHSVDLGHGMVRRAHRSLDRWRLAEHGETQRMVALIRAYDDAMYAARRASLELDRPTAMRRLRDACDRWLALHDGVSDE